MHPLLKQMLVTRVTLQPPGTPDVHGDLTWGAATSICAHLEPVPFERLPPQGRDDPVRNFGIIYVDGCDYSPTKWPVRSKVGLPDGQTAILQRIETFYDPLVPGVVDHYKLTYEAG